MKINYLFCLMVVVLIGACATKDNFQDTCPYEPRYPFHGLRVPVSIDPHQPVYLVGDTIWLKTEFSDSINDLSLQQTFVIEDFPFQPVVLLYRIFDNELGGKSWESGFAINPTTIDSVYEPRYVSSGRLADEYVGRMVYENDRYHFEMMIIAQRPGNYIMGMTDLYNERTSSQQFLNDEADAVDFVGKCPQLKFSILPVIDSGDNHLLSFKNELFYLDKEVYDDGISSLNDVGWPGWDDLLGNGPIVMEYTAFYGFEVVAE